MPSQHGRPTCVNVRQRSTSNFDCWTTAACCFTGANRTFVIRGPGITPNTTFSNPASQVDTMPTVLGLAGIQTPESMDGRSIVPLLIRDSDKALGATRRSLALDSEGTASSWRTEQVNGCHTRTCCCDTFCLCVLTVGHACHVDMFDPCPIHAILRNLQLVTPLLQPTAD